MTNSFSNCSLLSSPESQSAVFAAVSESEPNVLLRDDAADDSAPIYGGLSRRQVLTLIRTAQAGTIDPFAFMLALAWHRNQQPSPALLKATEGYFREVFGNNQPRLMREFARASLFLLGYPSGPINRELVGYAKWWKVILLEYMLQNPKPVYRTGKFTHLLMANALSIDPKEIRAFCRKHNIARDSRPGRPTKKETR